MRSVKSGIKYITPQSSAAYKIFTLPFLQISISISCLVISDKDDYLIIYVMDPRSDQSLICHHPYLASVRTRFELRHGNCQMGNSSPTIPA